MIWKVIIVLAAAVASYFIPTPQELRDAFIGGQNLYASGNYERAIEQYDYIIETESDFLKEDSVQVDLLSGEFVVSVRIAAYYQKANALSKLELKDSAITIFRIVESKQEEPKLAALAQFQIYDIYYRGAKYEMAIAEAKKLLDKYPDNKKAETALYDIGWAYRELNNLEKSSEAFQELVNRYPETEYLPRAIYQMGQNNFDLKNYDEAILHWEALNEKFKPEAFKQQDWENVQLKSVKERRMFEATAGRETDESILELVAKAQVKIGDSYKNKNNFEESINSYRKVINTYSLLPILVEVSYVKMADYTLEQKGLDSARFVYQSAIDQNFNNRELQAKMQYKIAEMYQSSDQFDKAAEEFVFYIRGYSDVAKQIEFDVDKAQYSVVGMYYNAKRYQDAVNWSDSLINQYPFSDALPNTLLLKGLSLNSLQRYDEARNVFENIVSSYPQSPEVVPAKVQIGYTLYQQDKYEEALAAYNEVLEKHPQKVDSSQVFFEIENTLYELGRYDEAIAAFEKVKFGTVYYPAAFGKLIKIYSGRSEIDKGTAFLDSLLKIDEKVDSVYYKPDIYFALADLSISKGDYSKAVEQLTQVVNDSTKEKEILRMQAQYARGVLYYQLENYSSAISDLESINQNQTFTSRFKNYESNIIEKLALSYSKTGKKEKALEMINTLMATAPNDSVKGNYYGVISNIYYEAGDYQKAIESANNVINRPELSDEIKVNSYITLSQSYKALGQMEKAADLLVEASEKFPQSKEIPAVLYSLAALSFDGGDYQKAADLFNKFIARYPENPSVKEAKYFRAYSHYESGNFPQAYNSFKQFAASYPSDPLAAEAQYFAAEALFNSKDYNKAVAEYRVVYQRYPNSSFASQALYNEGWSYFELQQPEKMVDAFKRLAAKYPNSEYAGDGLFTVGDYYYNIKDYPKAADAYNELIAKFPNYQKVEEAKELVYDLSQINSYLEYEQAMKFFDNKEYERAIKELKKLLEKYPNESIAVGCRVNIAASYEMLEEYREAANWYKQIINKYSNSSDDNERSAVIFAKEHLEWLESNYL